MDTFANRDEPIPVFNIPGSDDGPPGSSSDEENNRQSEHLKPTALVAGEHDGSNLERAPKSHKRNPSLQDRLFAKFVRCRYEAQRLEKAEIGYREMGN